MSTLLRYTIYILIVLIGSVAGYTILNAGNPHSLVRAIFPDPAWDLYVAMGSSLLVFILGFFVFYDGDRQAFRTLVAMNARKIRSLREAGSGDEEIAEAILAAMGSYRGYKHNLNRKKLVLLLGEFE